MSDTDDETRRALRAADPAHAMPDADPTWVAALLEETMSQPTADTTPSTRRSRWLLIVPVAAAAAVAAVVIGVRGSDDGDGSADIKDAAVATNEVGSVTELSFASGASAKCLRPTPASAASQTVAFEGIVTEVADGKVSLRPTRFYTGTETSRVVINEPDRGMSEAPAEFVVGESFVVGARDGEVSICGLTGPADADILALYEAAFKK